MTERTYITDETPKRCLHLEHDYRHGCSVDTCKACLARKCMEARQQAADLGGIVQRQAQHIRELEAALKEERAKTRKVLGL